MKKIIMILGLLAAAQGYVSVHAMKRALTPQEYVMSGLVTYLDIMTIRKNVENRSDAQLIEAFQLDLYGGTEQGQARLKVIRELTPEELEQKKKDWQMPQS